MIEKTLILVKPDGVQRGLVGEIVKRFETRGLKIAALKMVHGTEEQAKTHYKLTPEWIETLAKNTRKAAEREGKEITLSDQEIAEQVQSWLADYVTESPIVAIIFEGYHAVKIGRKLIGDTQSLTAAPGTIRGDYGVESYQLADSKKRPVKNLVHASGTPEEAEHEISVWFKDEEVFDYEKKDWQIIH